MSTSTLTGAIATASLYRAMFTLSDDNIRKAQYQPLLSTFNEKTKIKKLDHTTFSELAKQTILSSHRVKIGLNKSIRSQRIAIKMNSRR